jgi:hypothetical protein
VVRQHLVTKVVVIPHFRYCCHRRHEAVFFELLELLVVLRSTVHSTVIAGRKPQVGTFDLSSCCRASAGDMHRPEVKPQNGVIALKCEQATYTTDPVPSRCLTEVGLSHR